MGGVGAGIGVGGGGKGVEMCYAYSYVLFGRPIFPSDNSKRKNTRNVLIFACSSVNPGPLPGGDRKAVWGDAAFPSHPGKGPGNTISKLYSLGPLPAGRGPGNNISNFDALDPILAWEGSPGKKNSECYFLGPSYAAIAREFRVVRLF